MIVASVVVGVFVAMCLAGLIDLASSAGPAARVTEVAEPALASTPGAHALGDGVA